MPDESDELNTTWDDGPTLPDVSSELPVTTVAPNPLLEREQQKRTQEVDPAVILALREASARRC
jgi:hypothetical protein